MCQRIIVILAVQDNTASRGNKRNIHTLPCVPRVNCTCVNASVLETQKVWFIRDVSDTLYEQEEVYEQHLFGWDASTSATLTKMW